VRHSIAEDRRDINGLVATLAEACVYKIVPTGQVWRGHEGAQQFYTELFAAFPDNAFALREIVVGPQGVFEVATLTATNSGPWAGAPPSGLPIELEVLILFPWEPSAERFGGERIWFDRSQLTSSALAHHSTSFQISGASSPGRLSMWAKSVTARLRWAMASSSRPVAWKRSARLFSRAA
jgi:predicted ester cyclase